MLNRTGNIIKGVELDLRDLNLGNSTASVKKQILSAESANVLIAGATGAIMLRYKNYTGIPISVIRPSGEIELVRSLETNRPDFVGKFIIMESISKARLANVDDDYIMKSVSENERKVLMQRSDNDGGFILTILEGSEIHSAKRGIAVPEYMLTVANAELDVRRNKCLEIFPGHLHGPTTYGYRYSVHANARISDSFFVVQDGAIIEVRNNRDGDASNVVDIYATLSCGDETRIASYPVEDVVNNPSAGLCIFSSKANAEEYVAKVSKAPENVTILTKENIALKEEIRRKTLENEKLTKEKEALKIEMAGLKAKAHTSFWQKTLSIIAGLIGIATAAFTFFTRFFVAKET